MDDEPWWSAESVWRLPAADQEVALLRISTAVEQHMVLRTSPDELARRRADRWLRAHGLAVLADGEP
ncbi:hypothetical protein [Actinokineospora iranica]|uniref:Uncharacterized protein n=1 Tax=Actinokineospora iranica TaxID=1271860 RepID=A0A1G6R183_9PSEU|nr:hypothetical protein [Actinokineospora iranica]SDC97747.1 hypothetical protein SAMN05216174_10657 [Actinokineospora iranica]